MAPPAYPTNIIDERSAEDLARLFQGSYGNSYELQNHVLYDTLLFTTAVTQQNRFFTTPISGPYGAGSKSRQETNLSDPGKLPSRQAFIMKKLSVGFIVPHTGGTDLDTMASAFFNTLRYTNLQLHIAGRDFDMEIPGSLLLPAVGLSGVNSAANPASYGTYLSTGEYMLTKPIVLGELVSFDVTATVQSAVAAINTILGTAWTALTTANAAWQFRLHGSLIKAK